MKMTMKQINRYLFPLLILIAVFLAFNRPKVFTKEERLIIRQSDSVMYVTVWPEDSAVLRTPCADLTKAELKSKELQTLMAKMLATVRAPQHDGVGIAAPQVGISKRIICLQRFDKDGGPFECYLNAHIDSLFGDIGKGPEGCLSVPPMRGLVPRYTDVIVSYVHPETHRPWLHRGHLPARMRPPGRPSVHRPGRHRLRFYRLGSGKAGVRLYPSGLVAAAVVFSLPAVSFR